MNYSDADDIFSCIFLTENAYVWIEILLKFVPLCPTDSKLALVQIMIFRFRFRFRYNDIVSKQATSHHLTVSKIDSL